MCPDINLRADDLAARLGGILEGDGIRKLPLRVASRSDHQSVQGDYAAPGVELQRGNAAPDAKGLIPFICT